MNGTGRCSVWSILWPCLLCMLQGRAKALTLKMNRRQVSLHIRMPICTTTNNHQKTQQASNMPSFIQTQAQAQIQKAPKPSKHFEPYHTNTEYTQRRSPHPLPMSSLLRQAVACMPTVMPIHPLRTISSYRLAKGGAGRGGAAPSERHKKAWSQKDNRAVVSLAADQLPGHGTRHAAGQPASSTAARSFFDAGSHARSWGLLHFGFALRLRHLPSRPSNSSYASFDCSSVRSISSYPRNIPTVSMIHEVYVETEKGQKQNPQSQPPCFAL
ncbi:hypothetical protein J3F83DRAFT_619350 [Trichoderma novae-zelandiae]